MLPTAVTSAEPVWIPYSIGAGQSVDADPRERHLEALRRLTFDGASTGASWHPDGRRIVFEQGSAGGCSQIALMDLGTGRVTPLTKSPGWARSPTVAGDDVIYSFSTAANQPCGTATSLLGGAVAAADLMSVPLAGGPPTSLFAHPAADLWPSASADGAQLSFVSARDGEPAIYLGKLQAGSLRRLADVPGRASQPRLSPDGTRLVWQTRRRAQAAQATAGDEGAPDATVAMVDEAHAAIAVAGALGQNPRVLTAVTAQASSPAFLADSRRLVFSSDVDGDPQASGLERNVEIYLVDPDAPPGPTGSPTLERVTYQDHFDGQPQPSPDGRYLLFTSARGGNRSDAVDLYVARWVDDPD